VNWQRELTEPVCIFPSSLVQPPLQPPALAHDAREQATGRHPLEDFRRRGHQGAVRVQGCPGPRHGREGEVATGRPRRRSSSAASCRGAERPSHPPCCRPARPGSSWRSSRSPGRRPSSTASRAAAWQAAAAPTGPAWPPGRAPAGGACTRVACCALPHHTAAAESDASSCHRRRWKQQLDRCWQRGRKRSVAVCEGHSSWVNAARFSPAGVVVSGSADQSVTIWCAPACTALPAAQRPAGTSAPTPLLLPLSLLSWERASAS
jgi:hypothetical protein